MNSLLVIKPSSLGDIVHGLQVPDRGSAVGLVQPVGQGSLEQFGMVQPAHGAAFAICHEDAGTELLLVHPPLGEHGDVLAPRCRGCLGHPGLGWPGFVSMGIFAATLVAGLAYVWKKGVLDWNA